MKPYGTLALTVTSPVQTLTEPIELNEAKKFLNLPDWPTPDSTLDDMISNFIVAARIKAEAEQGRDLVQKQWDFYLDYFFPVLGVQAPPLPVLYQSEIELRQPLISVDLMQYRDYSGATVVMAENTDYVVDLNRATVSPPYNQTWPSFVPAVSSSILIRFTSGGDFPAQLRPPLLWQIYLWYYGAPPMISNTFTPDQFQVRIDEAMRLGAVERVR